MRQAPALQLAVNGVKAKFVVFKQQQALRVFTQYLATQLPANGAARTGDQHHLAAQFAGKQGGIWRHGVTTQQIFDIKLAQVLHADASAGQVMQTGQCARVDRQSTKARNDLVAPFAGGAGQCQHDVGGLQFAHHIWSRRCRKYRHAVDGLPKLAFVVIQKAQ